jgi:hypothetical protein
MFRSEQKQSIVSKEDKTVIAVKDLWIASMQKYVMDGYKIR